MVARTLGGEGLSFHNGGDSLKVTRATLPVIRLRVTNHGPSVSAEWVTETRRTRVTMATGCGGRVLLNFHTDPTSGLILRKQNGEAWFLTKLSGTCSRRC
jgi:hypothetical protein